MDQALMDVHDCMVAFIDNILVLSLSWDEHLQHVCWFLMALYVAGLIAYKKSHIGRSAVQYRL